MWSSCDKMTSTFIWGEGPQFSSHSQKFWGQEKSRSRSLEAGTRDPPSQGLARAPPTPGYLSWLYLPHPLGHLSQRLPHTREKDKELVATSCHSTLAQPTPSLPGAVPSPCWPHLHLHEPPQVRAVVRKVDLAQCLHVLISDLLCCCSLITQQELIEEPGGARAQSVLPATCSGLLQAGRPASLPHVTCTSAGLSEGSDSWSLAF